MIPESEIYEALAGQCSPEWEAARARFGHLGYSEDVLRAALYAIISASTAEFAFSHGISVQAVVDKPSLQRYIDAALPTVRQLVRQCLESQPAFFADIARITDLRLNPAEMGELLESLDANENI